MRFGIRTARFFMTWEGESEYVGKDFGWEFVNQGAVPFASFRTPLIELPQTGVKIFDLGFDFCQLVA